VLDKWSYRTGVRLSFIRPGRPNENAYIESFNGKFRDECLNEHWFLSIARAQCHRSLAHRVQHRTAAQLAGQPNPEGIREQPDNAGRRPCIFNRGL